LHRIKGDGQNQSPYHQRQERRKDLKAKRGQGENEAGADKNVQETGSAYGGEFSRTFVIEVHSSLLCQVSYK
jgi:hypothetical protein